MNVLADILHFILMLMSVFGAVLVLFWLAHAGSRLVLFIFA